MSQRCSDLIHFADGEIDPERAHAFRVHLLTCESCRIGLVEALQLDARLADLPPIPLPAKPAVLEASGVQPAVQASGVQPAVQASSVQPAVVEASGVQPAVEAASVPKGNAPLERTEQDIRVPAPVKTHRRVFRCTKIRGLMVGAVPAAAIATSLVIARIGTVAPPAASVFAEIQTRPYEVRFAYAAVTAYRSSSAARGGHHIGTHAVGPIGEPAASKVPATSGKPAASGDRVPYGALEALERRGDLHGLAIARVWNMENLPQIAEQLHRLPQTPLVRNDRVAIDLLATKNDNIETVLAELEELRRSDVSPVARAARWNYALALSRLELPHSAAQAFLEIADEREPGWSEEAATRAEAEAREGRDARTRWGATNAAGLALVKMGAPVSSEIIQQLPGLMRMHFYNAVRAASSRERVLALAPMADQLDRIGGRPVLRAYVERVARADFRQRAPLAALYAKRLERVSLGPQDLARLTATPPSDDVADIVMGALIDLKIATRDLDAFRTLTRKADDPWFAIALGMAEGAADIQKGRWLAAEARLRDAEKLCDTAVRFQCFSLALQLGKLYQDLHRVPEALAVLYDAMTAARTADEWGEYRDLLWRLADVERFHSSTATARAFATEYLHMADGCDKRWAYRTLTGAAVLDVDGRAARRYLEAALECSEPDLLTANYLTDIGRLDPQPDDLPRLQGWLSKLRAGGTLTPAGQVLADEIEGRLLVERDRSAGRALLERAIAAARKLPGDVVAEKARAGAYSVLAFDAARQRDHSRVVALTAEALGMAAPGACAVGMVAEDERSVVAVRDADGRDSGAFDDARGPRAGAPVISDVLASQLTRCERVQVMAQAALQGEPRVLPAELSWSYATGSRPASASHDREPRAGSALVVANVKPPAALDLAELAPMQAPAAATVLSGPAATPGRVLAAMTSASEIQFHTHAMVNLGVSDASHLVLSPDHEGTYALTAEAIRGTRLSGHPVIVLAACESAQGARYQHAPWSLPHAFLAAGARAVFAAATKIPDREAGPFFDRILARVRAGADPAAALREERVAALDADPSSWAADVILFE
jgi:hypothetical protein